jgi:protein O-mannosyl-transferase
VLFLIDYFNGRKFSKKVVIEKLPFFMLAAIFGVIALHAARTPFLPYETVPSERVTFSLVERMILSGYALWDYLLKAFLPLQLTIFYPYPIAGKIIKLPLIFYVYFIGMIGFLGLIYKYFRKERALLFGLGFFFFTIFFNLPLFNAGYSLSGDRFTYLPYLGIFFVVGYYAAKFYEQRSTKIPRLKYRGLAAVLSIVVFFSFLTFERCKVWKDAGTLWYDVVKKFPKHPLGYDNLANYLFEKGENNMTLRLCDEALALNARYYTAHYRKGNVYLRTERLASALAEYNQALQIFPHYYQALVNRGGVYYLMGETTLATQDFSKALEIYPDDVSLLSNRGTGFLALNRLDEASRDFEAVLKLNPENIYAKQKLMGLIKK